MRPREVSRLCRRRAPELHTRRWRACVFIKDDCYCEGPTAVWTTGLGRKREDRSGWISDRLLSAELLAKRLLKQLQLPPRWARSRRPSTDDQGIDPAGAWDEVCTGCLVERRVGGILRRCGDIVQVYRHRPPNETVVRHLKDVV
jgi:hypothetical protein